MADEKLNILTLAMAKKYTDNSLAGAGAVAGVPCQIQSITPITGGNRVTFLWVDNNNVSHTSTLDVMNGLKGDKGDQGEKGATGIQGPKGEQGEQGLQGIQGAQGIQGDQGIQGIQGIQGVQGPKGDDGYPFLIYKQYDDIAEFDEDDFPEIGLMFMVMQEDFDPDDPSTSIGYPIYRYTGEGNPPYSLVVHLASQGIKGEKGDKGDTGAQGPQGEQGAQGIQGIQGVQGPEGPEGPEGPQGVGVPNGGTTGQVLVKLSDNDFDIGFKGTTNAVTQNSTALVESGAVFTEVNAINSKIPSNASSSNKLVTESDTNSITLTSTDSLASWAGNAKGVMTAFIGTSSKPSDIGSPLSSWGETMIWCIGHDVRKTLFAIDFSVTPQVIYTRGYYNGSFITDWTPIKDGNLTSSVTSGSTAPITSGGCYAYLAGSPLIGKVTTTLGRLGFGAPADNFIKIDVQACDKISGTPCGSVGLCMYMQFGIVEFVVGPLSANSSQWAPANTNCYIRYRFGNNWQSWKAMI